MGVIYSWVVVHTHHPRVVNRRHHPQPPYLAPQEPFFYVVQEPVVRGEVEAVRLLRAAAACAGCAGDGGRQRKM